MMHTNTQCVTFGTNKNMTRKPVHNNDNTRQLQFYLYLHSIKLFTFAFVIALISLKDMMKTSTLRNV